MQAASGGVAVRCFDQFAALIKEALTWSQWAEPNEADDNSGRDRERESGVSKGIDIAGADRDMEIEGCNQQCAGDTPGENERGEISDLHTCCVLMNMAMTISMRGSNGLLCLSV